MRTYLMETIKYSFGVVLSILMSFVLIDLGSSSQSTFIQLFCLTYSVIFVAVAIFFTFYATKNWTDYKTAKKEKKHYEFLSYCERMNDIYTEDPIGDEIDRVEEVKFKAQEEAEKAKSNAHIVMLGFICSLLFLSSCNIHENIGTTKGTRVCHEQCYFKTVK